MSRNKLIRNIFIVSCLVAILYPLVNIYFIFPSFTGLLIENTESEAKRLGNHLAGMLLMGDSELTKADIARHFSSDETSAMLRDFNLIKLKIFSPSGETLYSSTPEDIGIQNSYSYFHEIVAKGKTYTKVVKKDTKSLEGQVVTSDVMETYVPIMRNDKFLGAFEVYFDITDSSRKLNNVVLHSSIVPLVLMVVFLGFIIAILVRGGKNKTEVEIEKLPGIYRSPFYPLLFLTISIFITEVVLMLIVRALPAIGAIYEAIFDATLLVILLSPTLYFFLLRPLIMYIAERKDAEERMNRMAYFDDLTGLPNRNLFQDRLKSAMAHADRYKRNAAVLFLDLDNFKRINDTFDHRIGDLLLKEVAERLKSCLRESDTICLEIDNGSVSTIARMGGDEFTILLSEINDFQDAARVAERILKAMSMPFRLDKHEVFTTGSIGIAIYPLDGDNIDNLQRNADSAMYHAKSRDRNNFQFYKESMNDTALKKLNLENDIRKALERDEFLLHYQPQIDISTGKITGMEALIRWYKPDKTLVSPAEFIPVAEESDLIVQLGEWVLRTACRQMKVWQQAGIQLIPVAVNLSSKQFTNSDLINLISKIIYETSLDPGYLELEITESTLMKNAETIISKVKTLKEMGIRLAMDDFGTGYSSFSYLKRFPLDVIKIDRSFIMDIPEDNDAAAIVAAIIAMGKTLKLKIVAEGVETEQQLAFLADQGCHVAQGYYFSRPLSVEDASKLFVSGGNAPHCPGR